MSELAKLKAILDRCESPIEFQLASCLATLLFDSCDQVVIKPQFRLDRYRFDFAIINVWDGAPLLLVECDGREFHASAKQRDNDRKKDAIAVENGVSLVRFPGDQIYLHPMECAKRAVHLTACAIINHRRQA